MVNIAAGRPRFEADVQADGAAWASHAAVRTQSALLFLATSNWLELTGARSLESPPRSLDMEILEEGGKEDVEDAGGDYFYSTLCVFLLNLDAVRMVSGDQRLCGGSPDREHN